MNNDLDERLAAIEMAIERLTVEISLRQPDPVAYAMSIERGIQDFAQTMVNMSFQHGTPDAQVRILSITSKLQGLFEGVIHQVTTD